MNRFFCYKNATQLIAFSLTLLLLMCTETSSATNTTGGGLPYEDWLTKVVDSMTGPLAFSISVIGIVIAGSTLIFSADLSKFALTLIILVLIISFIIAGKNTLAAITGVGALIEQEPFHSLRLSK